MKTVAQNVLNADRQKPAAEQQYSDIESITDDNYFPIASLERLGTAQDAQFQSGDQLGANWNWASNLEDEYGTTGNNSYAEMPREYHSGNNAAGGYYNWYGSTAETGHYVRGSSSPVDSICPSGWGIAITGDSSTDKSWSKLANAYGWIKESTYSDIARKTPFSFVYSGAIIGGNFARLGAQGQFWASTYYQSAYTPKLFAGYFAVTSSGVEANQYDNKVYGLNVRCIKKDDPAP